MQIGMRQVDSRSARSNLLRVLEEQGHLEPAPSTWYRLEAHKGYGTILASIAMDEKRSGETGIAN